MDKMENDPDILEQLKAPHGYFGRTVRSNAACEIESLRKQIKRLKNALKPFAEHAETYADVMPDSLMVMEYLFRFRDAKEALDDSQRNQKKSSR